MNKHNAAQHPNTVRMHNGTKKEQPAPDQKRQSKRLKEESRE